MGANMARRLKDKNYEISAVYDIDQDAAAQLAEELGCEVAANLEELTHSADVVMTVVSDDDAMRSLFTESGDSLLNGAEGKTFIHCATLSPPLQVELADLAKKAGASTLEACMASSITQAREGTLYLMVGGPEEIFRKHLGLLEDLSAKLRYIGGAGEAAKVKALVNMVMNINTAALAEGLGLGDAMGLDLKMLCEVFSETGANSRVLETDSEDMLARDHEVYFSAAHAAKDSGIANQLAADHGVDVSVSQTTESQYQRLVELGYGEEDKSVVAELSFPGRGKPQEARS